MKAISKRNKFISLAEPLLGKAELKYVSDCLKTNWISSLGKYVIEFEESFADFCGVKYGIATSNGTAALHLTLSALGIGKGDEVIVPSLTFVATANAVVYTGARPVFADSDPETWNIAPSKLDNLITKKTKAIIPVHLYGHPADLDPIIDIAKRYGIFIIEDAAEAHGALYKGKKVGSFGDAGCFSFYGNKIITTGEGGMVVTDNKKLAQKMKLLRDHAMSKVKKYWHKEIGFNYRLTNLQAALGVAQLKKIEFLIKCKRQIASVYNELLNGVCGITLPPQAEWAKNVFWMYSILVEKKYGLSRNQLMSKLKMAGIDSRPFFCPIHTLPPYKSGIRLPVAERLSRKGISLPSGAILKKTDMRRICDVIKTTSTKVTA